MALSKIMITNEDDSNRNTNTIEALFNPKEYSISKQSTWVEYNQKGHDAPSVHFSAGQRKELKMELFFDTTVSKKNVKEYVEKLEKLMLIIDISPKSKLKRPPKLFVSWGKEALALKCVLEHMEQRYTMFSEEGTPLRAIVNVTFKEINEDKKKKSGEGKSNSSNKKEKVVTFKDGDSLSKIANKEAGSPEAWKKIAKYNNISDPLNIKPGTKIKIPSHL